MYKRNILAILSIVTTVVLVSCANLSLPNTQVIFQPLLIQVIPLDFSAEKVLLLNLRFTPNGVTIENPEIELKMDKSSELLTDLESIRSHFDNDLVDASTIPLKINVDDPGLHKIIVRVSYDNSPDLRPKPLEGESRIAGAVNVAPNSNGSRLYSEETFIFEVSKNFDINYMPDLRNRWESYNRDSNFDLFVDFLKKQQNTNSNKIQSEFYFSDKPQVGKAVTLTYRVTPSFDIGDWDNNNYSQQSMGMWIRTSGLKILDAAFNPDLPEESTGRINGKLQNGYAQEDLAVWVAGPVVKNGESAEIILTVEPMTPGWGYVFGHYEISSKNAPIQLSDTKAYFVLVDEYKTDVSNLITKFENLQIPLYRDYFIEFAGTPSSEQGGGGGCSCKDDGFCIENECLECTDCQAAGGGGGEPSVPLSLPVGSGGGEPFPIPS